MTVYEVERKAMDGRYNPKIGWPEREQFKSATHYNVARDAFYSQEDECEIAFKRDLRDSASDLTDTQFEDAFWFAWDLVYVPNVPFELGHAQVATIFSKLYNDVLKGFAAKGNW